MTKILHILRSEPDDTVADLIAALGTAEGATVVGLYRDGISGQTVDWDRLVDDIFAHHHIICWW